MQIIIHSQVVILSRFICTIRISDYSPGGICQDGTHGGLCAPSISWPPLILSAGLEGALGVADGKHVFSLCPLEVPRDQGCLLLNIHRMLFFSHLSHEVPLSLRLHLVLRFAQAMQA